MTYKIDFLENKIILYCEYLNNTKINVIFYNDS